MKRCSKCNQDKEESEFSKRENGRLQSYCKECRKCYCRQHYIENKQIHNKNRYERIKKLREEHVSKIVAIKDNHPCTDCGIRYPHYILEFDHIDDNKKANVADMPGNYSWAKIEKEIKKCDIVCSNCHRKRTWQRKRSVA